MAPIRVVWGTATGPTAVAAYDAALADAGVHDYNLVTVSSVVPAGVPIEISGTAPDLGPVGEKLTVVQAKATVEGTGRATAGLGWTRSEGPTAAEGDEDLGPGVFYEAGGEFDEAEARRRIGRGLEHASDLRERDMDGVAVRTASVGTDGAPFATAVVLAVYGESEPIV